MNARLKDKIDILIDRLPPFDERPCGLVQVAPLWPEKGTNLGTLRRSCDAVGACLVTIYRPWTRQCLKQGHTTGRAGCHVHIVEPWEFIKKEHAAGTRIVGVELAHGAIELRDLWPAHDRTIVVLGAEGAGIPPGAMPYLTEVVEIPMKGVGASLNVAVAGSLVAYKLSGLI